MRSVVEHIEGEDLSDVVLVGHSFGGTVIARVAMEIPERIRRLVFWNAFVPEDGNCLNDEVPPHYRELFDALAGPVRGQHGDAAVPDLARGVHQRRRRGAGASRRTSCSRPSPTSRSTTSSTSARFYKSRIPRSYLNCTEDIALPPGPDFGWHPRMSNRLGLYRLVQMPGSHEVIFTNPDGLADKLVEAGRD